ncbi:Ligase CoA and ATP-grasp 2 domain containing prot ein [Trichuris trichiura]|uniref:Succinate--CoA ligase [ADP-forming] subunit beta, mitochondrial n=1 Tax=Trichuris trichiura TaxID=36087 RepID=A0A077Z0C1_TRITR|nr:Ligase CoA and ATP-grasp 2 domain containing prot ein [Trichuris trichiura]
MSVVRRILRCAKRASGRLTSVRLLHLHEHQNKALLQKFGVNVERYVVVRSPQQVLSELEQLPKENGYVVKAQVLAGGRMKGYFSSGLIGGVHMASQPHEAASYTEQMIGHHLVTKQTGEEGVFVRKVMISEKVDSLRETYIAILLDREHSCPMIMVSPAGGIDVEETVHKHPHLMFTERVNIMEGLTLHVAQELAEKMQFTKDMVDEVAEQLQRLYRAFIEMDATQIEINPFIHTVDNKVCCVDAKLRFDDSAAFRHQEIFDLRNDLDMNPIEREASKYNLSYITLSGDIGCMVNGAGLAMATMDIIKHYGGEPANFLDVRGTVTESSICEALRILVADPKVRCVFINIFGGIVNCETVARGLIRAMGGMPITLPLVIRLCGTNDQLAYRLLEEAGIHFHHAFDFSDGAEKAVECTVTGRG